MNNFNPSFEVNWNSQPKIEQNKKQNIETFDIDLVFKDYKPNFSTDFQLPEEIKPEPFQSIDSLNDTIASSIFCDFCQKQFNFIPQINKL